jgi:hypothetical protein
MLGVLISPPKHAGSENPRSSARMIKKFGLLVSVAVDAIVFCPEVYHTVERRPRVR